jgi:predicted ATPase
MLGVDGERQLAVPPLALPRDDITPASSTLGEFDAVRFFEQRAQLVLPSFRLADDNAADVHNVCRRLDGLPLAIELAAARLRTLSVGQLAERLDDIFAVLVGGVRTAPRRHQTLRATLDWSYELLAEVERVLLRRLGVFAGAFSLEAASAVAASAEFAPAEVVYGLFDLVAKSLVVAEVEGRRIARYRLLDTTRLRARKARRKWRTRTPRAPPR